MLKPRQPDLSVQYIGLDAQRNIIEECPKLAKGKQAHLTDRERYDIYIENVCATLQGNLIKKTSEQILEQAGSTVDEVTLAIKQQQMESLRIKREKNRIITTSETFETAKKDRDELDERAKAVLEETKVKAEMYDESVKHREGTMTDAGIAEEVKGYIEEVRWGGANDDVGRCLNDHVHELRSNSNTARFAHTHPGYNENLGMELQRFKPLPSKNRLRIP